MLIILGGLPGSGKTTIAKKLASELGFVYIRIDSIEQALIRAGIGRQTINTSGYEVGYALAAENLQLNMSVIADSVNPLEITREAWRSLALKNKASYLEVEIICSDKNEHRQRVETRTTDILNQKLPNWADVLQKEYEPWVQDHLIIDTANISVDEAVVKIIKSLD